jgi:hypothetical protein
MWPVGRWRVLGVAVSETDGDPRDECDLIWLGLAGLANPIRPSVVPALKRFHRAGEAAQACPFGAPAPQGGHVGLDPGLIDEDEPARIKSGLPGSPTLAPTRDVGASLFEGEQCFF